MKEKAKKLLNNYSFQRLILAIIIMALVLYSLLRMSSLQMSDRVIVKRQFIYSIFIFTIIGGYYYSFFTGSRSIRIQTSFGLTRKEIFNSYSKKILEVFLWLIGIIMFYFLMDKIILKEKINILEDIKINEIILLSVFFFCACNVSLFLGILKVDIIKSSIVFLILTTVLVLCLFFRDCIYYGIVLLFILFCVCSMINKKNFMRKKL